jgi:hypothetical protein
LLRGDRANLHAWDRVASQQAADFHWNDKAFFAEVLIEAL